MVNHDDLDLAQDARDRAQAAMARATEILATPRPDPETRRAWARRYGTTGAGQGVVPAPAAVRPPVAPSRAAGGGAGDWRAYGAALEAAIGMVIAEEQGQAGLARRVLEMQLGALESRLAAAEARIAELEGKP
jgi:hypothetical protein